MAWDTERTRRLLLDAASAEFAAHGPAGARIEEISRRAGVNRERIYSYFGSKAVLFETVLAQRLDAALDAVSVSGVGAAGVGDFAGRYFDAIAADPDLARLVAWEGLEGTEIVALAERSRRATRVVDEIMSALPGVERGAAQELFVTIVTLCHAWHVMPNLSRVIADGDLDDGRRRGSVMLHARAVASSLATARTGQ
ncbi:TetR/AcrR family transcriptional regulator [Microbacterium sp. SSM24]|uniref:TetR/AcrR family transcriptional regulator n=1 Tax=Microbacterium sp. SSM24 TaxID=2991714 RepID=UPI0022275B3F|nr:TetR family transcriptional regulator [Microbacterium sp. SSM24]MCW3492679.1 TetR family transcriptional regulator [Microbacterium sp. SSM24]